MVTSQGSQAFCLKLNSHQSHMIEAFQKLYNDELMVDCTVSCEGGNIKAHKLVLSACSPYFTDVFSTQTLPNQYPIVFLKGIPYSDVKAIIEFMYRGEVTVPQNSLPSVLDSAKSLMITGLCDIKIANIDTPKNAVAGNTTMSGRKHAKKRKRGSAKSIESQEGDSEAGEQENSDSDQPSDADSANNKPFRSGGENSSISIPTDPLAAAAAIATSDLIETTDGQMTDEAEQLDHVAMGGDTSDVSDITLSATSTPSVSQSLRSSGPRLTPSAQHKASLRLARIEKLQAITGGLSGRKMWSDEETRALVHVWEEESGRVWASGGKKVLSLKKISELLQEENIDRDVSQVEGKIKALKRDYKAVKADRAIPAVRARMAPYMEKLETIFSREEL